MARIWEVKKRGYLWSANLSPYFCIKECIIAQLELNQKAFWLNFFIKGNGTEWLDYGLPTPSYHSHSNKGYILAYALDGYFSTIKNQDYLNDIIARFLITFKNEGIEQIRAKPNITNAGTYLPKIYRLKELQALKSISKKKCPQARADKFDDFVFWSIKFHCESLIQEQGVVAYNQLQDFATENFYNHKKGISTPIAKAKSIWHWYEERDWKIPNRKKYNTEEELKELYMTRQERARANAVKREKESKAKVLNMITGLYADEFKKKSGAWHIGKIAEAVKLNRDTVSKHIKEWEHNKGGLFDE